MSNAEYAGGPKYEATLYHGTTRQFERFARAYLGWGCGGPDTHLGFYLTDQQDAARWFALQQGGQGFVLSVQVRLLNPLHCTHTGLTSLAASVLAEGALAKGHDGIIFHCGPLGSTFVLVFEPSRLRIIGTAKVGEDNHERARHP